VAHGAFLPVAVRSRLFRRLFLEGLQRAFDAGELRFFSSLERLRDPIAFRRYLNPARQARRWLRSFTLSTPRDYSRCCTTTTGRLCGLHPTLARPRTICSDSFLKWLKTPQPSPAAWISCLRKPVSSITR